MKGPAPLPRYLLHFQRQRNRIHEILSPIVQKHLQDALRKGVMDKALRCGVRGCTANLCYNLVPRTGNLCNLCGFLIPASNRHGRPVGRATWCTGYQGPASPIRKCCQAYHQECIKEIRPPSKISETVFTELEVGWYGKVPSLQAAYDETEEPQLPRRSSHGSRQRTFSMGSRKSHQTAKSHRTNNTYNTDLSWQNVSASGASGFWNGS